MLETGNRTSNNALIIHKIIYTSNCLKKLATQEPSLYSRAGTTQEPSFPRGLYNLDHYSKSSIHYVYSVFFPLESLIHIDIQSKGLQIGSLNYILLAN